MPRSVRSRPCRPAFAAGDSLANFVLATNNGALAFSVTTTPGSGVYQVLQPVDVDLIDTDTGWSPYLSLPDAQKLDQVRKALRSGDVKQASQLGRVFQLLPIKA